jgi:S1-C subfamily serine protease
MSPKKESTSRRKGEDKSVTFFYLLITCVMGGIIGSTITFLVVAPGMLLGEEAQDHPGQTIIQQIYTNQTVQLENMIKNIFENNKDSIVYVDSIRYAQSSFGVVKSEASGSGFIVSSDGYVVTNDHVIADATNITVVLPDGEELPASIKGADPLNDVAVLKINPAHPLTPVKVGDSDKIEVGDFVVAIGSPYRLQNTMTFGVISAMNRTLTSTGGFVIEKVIQTDAAVNPGNSGGPLINLQGEVIGINTAIISQSGGSEGVGFTIPINTVRNIYTQIIESGKVSRPWLGITGTDVTTDMIQAWNIGVDYGVIIIDFADPSPAKNAGMRETISRPGQPDFVLGDIIVAIGGLKVDNNAGLLNVLLKFNPGDKVDVQVWRDGSLKVFQVTLGQRPTGA